MPAGSGWYDGADRSLTTVRVGHASTPTASRCVIASILPTNSISWAAPGIWSGVAFDRGWHGAPGHVRVSQSHQLGGTCTVHRMTCAIEDAAFEDTGQSDGTVTAVSGKVSNVNKQALHDTVCQSAPRDN